MVLFLMTKPKTTKKKGKYIILILKYIIYYTSKIYNNFAMNNK